MATYCYSNKSEAIERQFPMGQAPKIILENGKVFARDLGLEQRKSGNERTRERGNLWRTHTSNSLAVPAFQQKQMMDRAKALGVPTDYVRRGYSAVPDIRDATHKKRLARALGMVDFDAYY